MDADLREIIEENRERINIYGFSSDGHPVDAAISGGNGAFENVEGGYYDRVELSATVRKSDLNTFVPQPGMMVDARGRDMRIAPDGVTTGRAHYQLSLIARDSPSQ